MANLTLPNPSAPIATCPHCGAQVLIDDKIWYKKFVELFRDINLSKADIVAIKAFVGMP